jgi:uncharacterized damage-inducible protein DinB
MLRSTVKAVLLRDLAAVRRSVEAYPDDAALWTEVTGIVNTGGSLVLHLAGNLEHYLGAVLGGSGYVRDREAEFARRAVPRAELLSEIEAAAGSVERGIDALSDNHLAEPYPEEVGGRRIANGDFLVHLATHLAYHLGQLDYHRRMVAADPTTVGALSPKELPTR